MNITFCKYQGTGNDFIMIDNRANFFDIKNYSLVKNLCNRRFGIGADGLILLENHSTSDFFMRYYNSDGYEGSMCGNGGRCAIEFAHELNIIKEKTEFFATDGLHKGKINSKNMISLLMQNVNEIIKKGNDYELNTGSPHYVVFTKNLNTINVVEEGRKIRYNSTYTTNGINVNFVEIINGNVFVRTYERGVEEETLSCGTGVTAVALVCSQQKLVSNNIPLQINTKGGLLEVSFKKEEEKYNNIWLTGPAQKTFEGSFNLNDF
ncbi:MAG: diaminopimelate epimerase [Bacteroidota bacterium]|jgi:diaminopimelate epimerase